MIVSLSPCLFEFVLFSGLAGSFFYWFVSLLFVMFFVFCLFLVFRWRGRLLDFPIVCLFACLLDSSFVCMLVSDYLTSAYLLACDCCSSLSLNICLFVLFLFVCLFDCLF